MPCCQLLQYQGARELMLSESGRKSPVRVLQLAARES